jgi:UPF0271 protein
MKIDINCDMGESYGRFRIGNDEEIMPYISSCNIACGMHGGDPSTVIDTIQMASALGKNVGAHPSYPDHVGFGRRSMKLSYKEAFDLVVFQVATLYTLAVRAGTKLSHVKVHGALYNDAARDKELARPIVDAIKYIDPNLKVFTLPDSEVSAVAEELGMSVVREAFADRRYTDELTLQSRAIPGAVLEDPEMAADQVLNIVMNQEVETATGRKTRLQADTLCIHGDTPTAVSIAHTIYNRLYSEGINIGSW